MQTTIERVGRHNEADFLNCAELHPALGTKMCSHYLSYGTAYGFCGFWVQYLDEEPVGMICKYYEELFVLTNRYDHTIEAFLRLFSEKAVIWMDQPLGEQFISGRSVHSVQTGTMMKSIPDTSSRQTHRLVSRNTEVQQMLEILELSANAAELLYCDCMRKIMKGVGDVYGYKFDGSYVATVSALHAPNTVLLENIRTLPAYRRKGFVKTLVEIIKSCYNKKEIYLLSQNAFTDQVYERMAFEPAGNYMRIGM